MSNSYDALTSIGGGGNVVKPAVQARDARIAARAAASAAAKAKRDTRIAARETSRNAAIAKRNANIQSRAEAKKAREDKALDNIINKANSLSVKAVRGRDTALNAAEQTQRTITVIDRGIQANQKTIDKQSELKDTLSQRINNRQLTKNVLLTEQTNLQNAISALPPTADAQKEVLQAQLNRVNFQIIEISAQIASLSGGIDKATNVIAARDSRISELSQKKQTVETRQREKLVQVLEKQDETERQTEKKAIAQDRKKNPDRACACPAVYDPVVINGVTYSNSCEAACQGVTVPPNPVKPQPPENRICLQVITCGSDGNTYPTSCLPVGVYAIRRGGGSPCPTGIVIDEAVYKNPSTRPPVLLVANLVINR